LVLTPGTRGAAAQVIEVMQRHLLVPEVGKPEDIAAVECFLASNESRYINSQIYIADGGMLAHNPAKADLIDMATRRS
jgi:NAD(P)-dependent dehydrogenase (short-subunit alcohol dehydrogenase family)